MNTTTENPIQVAQTIADQIGRRALFMMGAKNLVGDATENSLRFQISDCREISHIIVKLEVADTYTVTFIKTRGINFKTVATVEDVYADNLHAVIESQTGLRLSL